VSAIRNRVVLCTVLSLALMLAARMDRVSTSTPAFHHDDPISREPETQDASAAEPWDIGLLYELTYNLAVSSRHVPSNTRAASVNTVDEVADSSWFTNRIGSQTMTADDIERGPNVGAPPAAGRWVIVREKSAGVNPGFTAKDANGDTWFVTFDNPSNPEGGSGAMVIASKLFWALGYNQVETFVTTVDPAKLEIDPGATKKRPSGARTPFTREDIDEVLDRAPKNPDGTYRVAAGRLLPGKILGGFRYEGTRPDDPNDIVPHEHRRELRALRVFGAWLNLTDLKGGNTLDTLVVENGRSIVKHVLQDVGSTFGMAQGARDYSIGYEYFYEGDASRKRLATFGLALSPWQTVTYREYPAIGRFEGDEFDPTAWKPHTPTTAFMEMRADDAFWAALRVMAFSDDLIRAAVRTGEYSDEAAQQYLASVLMKRRDAVGRAYLPAINPIVSPELDAAGTLTFENAAVVRGFAKPPAQYRAEWFWFDNATGESTRIGETQASSASIPAPPGVSSGTANFLRIDIAAESPEHPSWRQPIRTHFRRTSSGWQLVGLDRLPQTKKESRR
jgi:hypothetical protein